ncbi:MAG: hypothetical protein JW807_03715 [Spirochaetes bacterium]|nr:hypothetical protein [Spirochaetota bacterium]
MAENNEQKNKTKRERFVAIIENRTNKILDDLDSLGKCSNKKNYEYDANDVKQVFYEIEKKIKEIRSLFQEYSHKKNRFSLKKKSN